jgi:outer membrane protein
MEINRKLLAAICIVIGLALGFGLTWLKQGDQTVYVENQRVFEAFAGKRDLEEKLQKFKRQNNDRLDSLQKISVTNSISSYWIQQEGERIAFEEQQLIQKYNAEIWQEINRLITIFGRENNYQFIFGASGNGSLMYASEGRDVTEEAIKFINARYLAGP